MKVYTIEQYNILAFIEMRFETDSVSIELVDRFTVKVTDNKGDSLTFTYNNGEITWS